MRTQLGSQVQADLIWISV